MRPEPLELADIQRWLALPSSKIRRPRETSPYAWAYSYTAFSVEFARAALLALGARPGVRVIDPFVGSGTTLVAAATDGYHCTAVDLNPFSVLLSRTRLAVRVDERVVRQYLQRAASVLTADFIDEGSGLRDRVLLANDLAFVDALIEEILSKKKLTRGRLWKKILSDTEGLLDSEVVTLLSVALAARDATTATKGSNPVWYRTTTPTTKSRRPSLFISACEVAQRVIADLRVSPTWKTREHRVYNCKFSSLPKNIGQFTYCLTSPPYLNRLDYVVAHLPELEVLARLLDLDLDAMATEMTGTTKIRKAFALKEQPEWGRECANVLDKIRRHPTKASASYYYQTHLQYFSDLFGSFRNLRGRMKRNGRGLFVLQNSYYKGIEIDVAKIAVQMLSSLQIDADIVRELKSKSYMGLLSPTQKYHAPNKVLRECMIYARF